MDEQQGFRSGRSCKDAISVVRQVVEKFLKSNESVFLCVIDLRKPFDSIYLKDVIQILKRENFPENRIMFIVGIYSKNNIKIKSASL